MQIIRLTNPEAMIHPHVVDLFTRAFEDQLPKKQAAIIADMARGALNPNCGIFCGESNGRLTALLVMMLPSGPLMPCPMVTVLYNESADSATLRAICAEGMAFAKAAGYNKIWTMNQTTATDWAHARLFKFVGEATIIGSILEYEF